MTDSQDSKALEGFHKISDFEIESDVVKGIKERIAKCSAVAHTNEATRKLAQLETMIADENILHIKYDDSKKPSESQFYSNAGPNHPLIKDLNESQYKRNSLLNITKKTNNDIAIQAGVIEAILLDIWATNPEDFETIMMGLEKEEIRE